MLLTHELDHILDRFIFTLVNNFRFKLSSFKSKRLSRSDQSLNSRIFHSLQAKRRGIKSISLTFHIHVETLLNYTEDLISPLRCLHNSHKILELIHTILHCLITDLSQKIAKSSMLLLSWTSDFFSFASHCV